METKNLGRQLFDVQSDNLVLKEVISKNFLRVELWAINDDNPNNNYSHFDSDYYDASIPSFYEKPILGYYQANDNDFKAHQGENAIDKETGIEYWDNYNGERILGFIRHNDSVEVREKDGKKWIVVTAVLWTHYNFREIKKIVKDKKKRISVEISVEDAYFTDLAGEYLYPIEITAKHELVVEDENGLKSKIKYGSYIEHIEKFALEGITILGSKFGRPIKEGIEGASLSLLDENGRAMFSRQQQALCFAYQELDNETSGVVANNISKEDKGEMDSQDLNVPTEEKFNEQKADGTENQELNSEVGSHSENFEANNNAEEKECGINCSENSEENKENGAENKPAAQENEAEVCPECGKNPCECESKNEASSDGCENCAENSEEKECGNVGMASNEEKPEEKHEKQEGCDGQYCGNANYEGENDDEDKDENDKPEEDYAALKEKFEATSQALDECQKALAAQEEKFNAQSAELAKVKANCDEYLEINNKYKVEVEDLRKAVFSMLTEKRTTQANELMSKIEISEEKRNEILNNCKEGKYNESYDVLHQEIAVLFFDTNCKKVKTNEGYSVSIASGAQVVKTAAKKTNKEILSDYIK